jgi:hypothetical protein
MPRKSFKELKPRAPAAFSAAPRGVFLLDYLPVEKHGGARRRHKR